MYSDIGLYLKKAFYTNDIIIIMHSMDALENLWFCCPWFLYFYLILLEQTFFSSPYSMLHLSVYYNRITNYRSKSNLISTYKYFIYVIR